MIEAGCDEAGRGCLAGPVFAAAVILPKEFRIKNLNDSKQLDKETRNSLRIIIQKKALFWAVAMCDNQEIDHINILNASFQAMHRAIGKLPQPPQLLLIDGNRFNPYDDIPFECIIGGDAKYHSIAAASILAKTYRDDLMETLHLTYPQYHWDTNKGYPTEEHREALKEFGPTPFHRMTFQLLPLPSQGELFAEVEG